MTTYPTRVHVAGLDPKVFDLKRAVSIEDGEVKDVRVPLRDGSGALVFHFGELPEALEEQVNRCPHCGQKMSV